VTRNSCTERDRARKGPTGLPIVDAWDIAVGQPTGARPLRRLAAAAAPHPERVLRNALRTALLHPPCIVAFSGGRDSSLLLAVAADLAAREGLDPPIALTFRYPADPAGDESCWQELVVTHLQDAGLRFPWVCREITGELDIVGPLTAPVLRAHRGPTYPAPLGNTILLARHAAGGSLVTGNGGDEVLGGHRAAVLRAVARRRGRGLTMSDWRLTATCAAPRVIRRRLACRLAGDAPWLRPAVRTAALAETVGAEADRPLRWDHSVATARASRAAQVGETTRRRVAEDHDCMLVEPLASCDFIASYAVTGGPFGGIGRAAGIRLLAGGLLPDAVIERRLKAWFNASRFGPVAREFAENWDGGGVDERLVDPVELRSAWLREVPPASTAMLLQQAWLATS
jgi:hypothetical protein